MNYFIHVFKTSLTFLLLTASYTLQADIVTHPPASIADLVGTVWVEDDNNSMYDSEYGPSGIVVELIDAEVDTAVASALTIDGEYKFTGVGAGKYYLKIPGSTILLGGQLAGLRSCPGSNPADDMIDNDDNGEHPSNSPDVLTTSITIVEDTINTEVIEYIDFCFSFACDAVPTIAEFSCSDLGTENIICDFNVLDNLCGIMPSEQSPGNQPLPLCPSGGEPSNITWYAFIAAEGPYQMVITPYNCQPGQTGLSGAQIGIYTDCSFAEAVYCNPDCVNQPTTINANLMTPGQVYYLFIDGCDGSICNYEIDIIGDFEPIAAAPTDVCVQNNGSLECDTTTYCLSSNPIFEAVDVNLFADYTWSVTTVSGGPYTGDSILITTSNELEVSFDNIGAYDICLTDIMTNCADATWSGVLCSHIIISDTLNITMDEDFSNQFICEGDLNTFTFDVFDNEDPNGDGTFGWLGETNNPMLGLNEAIIPTDGCTYKQSFTLEEYPPVVPEDVFLTVCGSEFPIMYDVLVIDNNSFIGSNNVLINNYILVNTTNQFGCDSIINLNIERLYISNGFIEDPICANGTTVFTFNYEAFSSTDISFMNFTWQDFNGNPITDNDSNPLDISISSSALSGNYNLQVEIVKDGVTCIYNYPFYYELAIYQPFVPIIMGPDAVCADDGTSVYTATSTGGDVDHFDWTFPPNVQSGVISGFQDNTLTINWGFSSGGLVSVVAVNDCGSSDPASIDVDVSPTIVPGIGAPASICIDNFAVITYAGSTIDIVDYLWDFDGGVVLNGTGDGPGPHEVEWATSGSKVISVQATNSEGCMSSTVSTSIQVAEPLTPPTVTCMSTSGVVIFSWDPDYPGAQNFEVSVINGPQGIQGDGTYTMEGLANGQVVTIELLTIPTDMTCGSVSTMATCTAQDCSPAIIELTASDTSVCFGQFDDVIEITATIISGESGTGTFIGPGILDAENGIFDPDSADIGINTIVYSFSTDDPEPCFSVGIIEIEVKALPVASFVPNDAQLCVGESSLLIYTGDSSPDMLSWDYGDGGAGSGGENPSVTYATPGTKTITLTTTKDGCMSEEFSQTIDVFDVPVADFTILEDSICLGQPIEVMYTGTPDPIILDWDYDGGNGTGGENPTITYNSIGIKNISLTVTINGCVSEVSTQVVVVSEAEASFTLDETEYCIGATINPTYTGSAGVDVYLWDYGQDGTGTGGENPMINYTSTGNKTITLTVKSGGCVSEIFTETITITEGPIAEFMVANSSICVGQEFMVTYTGDADVDSYNWDYGQDGSGNGGMNPTIEYSSSGMKIISLSVVKDGCESLPFSLEVLVSGGNDASFVVDNDTLCVGKEFNITYTGAENVDEYIWDFGEGGTGTGAINPSVSYTTSGVKLITLVVTKNGCVSEIYEYNVIVEEPLDLIFISCAVGVNEIEFAWNEINGALGYIVTIDGSGETNVDSGYFLVDELGPNTSVTITVTPISNNSCPSVTQTITCETLVDSNDDILEELGVSVYPNPVLDVIYVNNDKNSELSYTLFDITGRKVLTGQLTNDQIDVSTIHGGMYILQLKSKDLAQVGNIRIVKE